MYPSSANSVIFNVGREKLVLEKVGICENTNFGSGARKTFYKHKSKSHRGND